MTDNEPFTFISTTSPPTERVSKQYEQSTSAHVADIDVQLITYLRARYPDLTLTVTPARNCPLLTFAALGHAKATLDTEHEAVIRWRGYVTSARRGERGGLGDATFFGFYRYQWGSEDFLLYTISIGPNVVQYILKEPDSGEHPMSHCAKTDNLILTAVKILLGDEDEFVYVYDDYWERSKALWEEVQKSSWENVILDEDLKVELQDVAARFFDSKKVYERYGVPWKRGLIFHGPPGNGKTVSLKALMKTLYDRKPAIPTLYVKSAPYPYNIAEVFDQARNMAPCLLVMEDIETIVTQETRSYFFNEVDGLANNDGILMIASTNYLEKLDPGLSQRPSRFDRKYYFPLPNKNERTLYTQYWRAKLSHQNPSLEFPSPLCPAIASITHGFSFAYLQEAFITTLLSLAKDETEHVHDVRIMGRLGRDAEKKMGRWMCRSCGAVRGAGWEEYEQWCQCCDEGESVQDSGSGEDGDVDGKDELDRYKLWRVIKVQIANLRKQIDEGAGSGAGAVAGCARCGHLSGLARGDANVEPAAATRLRDRATSMARRDARPRLTSTGDAQTGHGARRQRFGLGRVRRDGGSVAYEDVGHGGFDAAEGFSDQHIGVEDFRKGMYLNQAAFEWRL